MNSSSSRNNPLSGDEASQELLLYLEEQKRRNEDLFKFIDEFIVSDEYNEYVEMKKDVMKKSDSVQYCDRHLDEEDKYPLTTKSRKMLAFISKFEKYTRNRADLEILRKQERGIQIIKDKIMELKRIFTCTMQTRKNEKEKRDKKNLESFCESFNIDLRSWKDNNENKITQRILCYQKIFHGRKISRNRNMTAIVNKLVDEIRYKREVETSLRAPSRKFQRRDKIVKDMGVITLCPRYETVGVDDQEPGPGNRIERSEGDEVKIKEVEDKKKEKKDKAMKLLKDKKEKKSSKGSKKSQKTKEESAIILPKVTICNDRNIITTQDIMKIDKLIATFNDLDDIMEDKHLMTQNTSMKLTELRNAKFFCNPQMIIFNNFIHGKIYRKKLVMLNKSRGTQKLRLVGVPSAQEYDVLLFKMEPLMGIQKLASGCSIIVTVSFAPMEETREIEAALEFTTFDVESQKNETFRVDIRCTPSHADLELSSDVIYFGKIPFWQKENHLKVLKLRNKGAKPCRTIFKKIHNLLELPEMRENDRGTEEDITDNAAIDNWECNIATEVIDELLDNVFSTFSFEDLAIDIPSFQTVNLKIRMRNTDYIGSYLEKYLIDVYEGDSNVGNKEVMLHAEVTDHFLTVSPENLDFGVCISNSIYQLALNIDNSSSTTQAIAIKFPSTVADYVRSDVSNLYVPPQGSRRIWVKLSPRKTLFSGPGKHFDKNTNILEFSVQVCATSKNCHHIPPARAKIFAILTDTDDLAISPKTYGLPEASTLDMGECSIYETVVTNIAVENRTLSPQIYGFVNLPQSMTVSPNFGFGTLEPGENKILQLSFHPDLNDLKKFFLGEKFDNFEMTLDIHLDTISNLGQVKQEISTKKMRSSIDIILKELRTTQENELYRNIMKLKSFVRLEYFSGADEYVEDLNEKLHEYNMSIENEGSEAYNFRKYTTMKPVIEKNTISVNVRINRPLLELSCQYVELPDTPCGSHSFVEIELKALKAELALECDFLRQSASTNLPRYEARFEITGDNDEIKIEPTCGILRNGESRKLVLIAKPSIPQKLIQDTARTIKYTEIYEKRKRDFALRKLQSKSKQKQKNTKDRKEKKKGKQETMTTQTKSENKSKTKIKNNEDISRKNDIKEEDIEVRESDIILDYLDYYPAEMCYWRTMEPYTVRSKIVCSINYHSPSMFRKQETIYLDASVRVIRPDFITNLKTQRIQFGNVAIGMGYTEYIILQNIQYTTITPEVSVLNPVGPFRIPYIRDTNIPSEHFLKLPVIFEPDEDKQVEEYFEITSGKTILSIILEGRGVAPDIDFKPIDTVYRMESHKNKVAECTLQIINKSSAGLSIFVEKVFELEGFLKEMDRSKLEIDETNEKVEHEKRGSKGNKSKKSENTKEKKSKVEVGLHNLTEVEKYSISNNFTKIVDTSFFDILNVDDNHVKLDANSSKTLKIGFGPVEALLRKKKEIKEVGRKGKASKSPSEKQSTGSSKLKKQSAEKKYYVAKYNIKSGRYFVKDIILICTFK